MASYDDLDGLLDKLVDAAIDADMWERGFTWQDGGHYEDPMRFRNVYRGDPGRNDLGQSSDTTDYESEVFGQWPGVIEKFFAPWRADVLPDPLGFQSQVDALRDAARPIGLPAFIASPSVLRSVGRPAADGGGMTGLVRDIDADTARLRGRWADAFHAEYVTPLPFVLGNQAAMLELLASSIEAEAEMWKEVRQSVADLAEAGAEWFRATMHGGNVWELVVEVGKSLYTVFELRRSGNPVEAFQNVLGLVDHAVEIKALIDSNAPPDPRETGVPNDVAGVRTKVAQTLEYTINDHIVYTEERLETLLRGTVAAMRQSRGTFTMGDSHLERVRDASDLLAPVQVLTERGVERTVSSLFRLGDQVTAAAGGIVTSVHPFVRPGSIGLGSRGPYDQVLALENEISRAMRETAFNLERAGTSVRIAADLVFDADSASSEASGRADDRLAKAHDRFEHALRPSDRALPPYTPPEEQLHVEVPDCAPLDDPFSDAPQDDWHAPMAPPTR